MTTEVGRLLWVDLETTGLDPETETILEIAAVVTDGELREIDTFSMVTNEAASRNFSMLKVIVQKMHTSNGLWLESCHSPHSLHDVAAAFWGWAAPLVGPFYRNPEGFVVPEDVDPATVPKPPIAGSTVAFDRAFLVKHMRLVVPLFNHRNLDVSVLTEIAKRWWPSAYATRPGADRKPEDAPHRALADIRESISLLRHFLAKIGPLPIGEAL